MGLDPRTHPPRRSATSSSRSSPKPTIAWPRSAPATARPDRRHRHGRSAPIERQPSLRQPPARSCFVWAEHRRQRQGVDGLALVDGDLPARLVVVAGRMIPSGSEMSGSYRKMFTWSFAARSAAMLPLPDEVRLHGPLDGLRRPRGPRHGPGRGPPRRSPAATPATHRCRRLPAGPSRTSSSACRSSGARRAAALHRVRCAYRVRRRAVAMFIVGARRRCDVRGQRAYKAPASIIRLRFASPRAHDRP